MLTGKISRYKRNFNLNHWKNNKYEVENPADKRRDRLGLLSRHCVLLGLNI